MCTCMSSFLSLLLNKSKGRRQKYEAEASCRHNSSQTCNYMWLHAWFKASATGHEHVCKRVPLRAKSGLHAMAALRQCAQGVANFCALLALPAADCNYLRVHVCVSVCIKMASTVRNACAHVCVHAHARTHTHTSTHMRKKNAYICKTPLQTHVFAHVLMHAPCINTCA